MRVRVKVLLVLLSVLLFFCSSVSPSSLFSIKIGKLDKRTADLLENLSSDSPVSCWIFLKDKGPEGNKNYQKILQENIYKFPERTLKRRGLRGEGEVADYHDLPVYLVYIDSLKSTGVKIRTVSRWLNAVSVFATSKDIEKMAEFSFVEKIEKVATFRRKLPEISQGIIPEYEKRLVTDSLNYGRSYPQLSQIHIPELHNLGFTGRGVRIGMLDTGYYLHHQAFQHLIDSNRIVATHDFINGDQDVEDLPDRQREHGTYTLSALAGLVPDTLIGPAYNSEFVLAKTEIASQEIQIEEDLWIAGIEWEESLGVDIVSSSLGYTDWYTWGGLDTALCTKAADIAFSKGVIVVNAAGNERDDPWHYVIAPANGEGVVAVGAVDLNGNIAPFSSAGFPWDFQKGKIKPDVCACGVATYCANMYGSYSSVNGTSLSTPLVAGACALILEVHPGWSPIQLREALWKSSSQADFPDTLKGYGIINTLKASISIIYPDNFNFLARANDINPLPEIMNITNFGDLQLKWNAVPDVSWLNIRPDSGFTPSVCTLKVDISGLKKGVYRGRIRVRLSQIQMPDSIQMAEVTLVITGKNEIWVYPNPFSDYLTIYVGNSESKPVKFSIFNSAGELVYRKTEESFQEIIRSAWNGKNSKGEEVADGIYLLKIDVGKESEIVKIVKIR